MAITKEQRRLRIRRGIRNKISGTAERPRLSIFKSNKGIYAQLIDDANGNTLVATSSLETGGGSNIDSSKEVGKKLAEKATGNGIASVVFDRGGYPYHGRIKALAEGAREGGLKF
ncbi:MAG: 50S ribosomal protein L18 [Reichenbachiella sp.]